MKSVRPSRVHVAAAEGPGRSVAPSSALPPDAGGAPSDPASPSDPALRGRRLTTGEMARLSSNTLRTVRFYEEAGILRPVGRTDGGHRLFEHADLERLRMVSDLREAGLSLDEIRSLLELKSRAPTGVAAAAAAERSLGELAASLERKRDLLTRLLADVRETMTATMACQTCEVDRFFPDRCNECGKVRQSDALPRGMRVLWQIEPKST